MVLLGMLAFLAGCQGIDFGNSSFRPSSAPVTVDTVTRNDRLAGIAREQHPRILATYGGEYSDPNLERMVAKGSSNPSSVQENVPYETVRILLVPTIFCSLSPPIQQGLVYH